MLGSLPDNIGSEGYVGSYPQRRHPNDYPEYYPQYPLPFER